MRTLPIFHEIEIKSSDNQDLQSKLQEAPFGKAPIVISLANAVKNHKDLVVQIESYLEQEKIHTCFPFPIYIISSQNISTKQITVLSSRSKLPPYFNIQRKNPNPIESNLIHKINILSQKIRHFPLQSRFEDIIEEKRKARELFNLTREAQFYENLKTDISKG